MVSRGQLTRFAALALTCGIHVLAGYCVSASSADIHPRVMSLNVCTDQLVLGLADHDQIVSLSNLSEDPGLSFLRAKAAGYPKNRGLAEEVFVARPEIVVTGTYSLHTTTAVLNRLGVRVEEFAYAQTLDTIAADIRRMGVIVGQRTRAERIAVEFERELASFETIPPGRWPSVVVFEQNGIVLGAGTLADSILKAVGFRNLAAEQGYSGMVPYPLELLVKDRPDVVLVSRPYSDVPALADQITRHPAIAALGLIHDSDVVPSGSWSCGGPFTMEAVRALRRLRQSMIRPNKGKEG